MRIVLTQTHKRFAVVLTDGQERVQLLQIRRQHVVAVPVPDRYAMAPPELAADAPVSDVFVPGLERPGVSLGEEAELALPDILFPFVAPSLRRSVASLILRHRAEGGACQAVVGCSYVPLVAQVRFDCRLATIAVAHGVAVGLHIFEQVVFAEPFDDRLAGIVTVHAEQEPGVAGVYPAVLVADRCVGRKDVYHVKPMPFADFPVVGVVRRGDLQVA